MLYYVLYWFVPIWLWMVEITASLSYLDFSYTNCFEWCILWIPLYCFVVSNSDFLADYVYVLCTSNFNLYCVCWVIQKCFYCQTISWIFQNLRMQNVKLLPWLKLIFLEKSCKKHSYFSQVSPSAYCFLFGFLITVMPTIMVSLLSH